MTVRDDLPIRVEHPRRLPTWSLPARRTDLGEGYKPSLARLPDGELVLVSLKPEGSQRDGTYVERTPMWRSRDDGATWDGPVLLADVIGREQWLTCTADGTLFMSSHLLVADRHNADGVTHSYLHRSTDGGRTWERTKVLLSGDARLGEPASKSTLTSRNLVEGPDGSLRFGVSLMDGPVAWLWRSADGGRTWDRSQRVRPPAYGDRPYDNLDGFFCEDFTWPSPSGEWVHWIRCGPPSPMYDMRDGRAVPRGDDGIDRTLVCRSADGGATWSDLQDFGDYGMHYVRVLSLADGRVLLTYTQRSTFYPLGVRALISWDDGRTWDFGSDRIVVDGQGPWGATQGGGFGNTVQLAGGDLLTCYSYRTGSLDATLIEVARWRLPD